MSVPSPDATRAYVADALKGQADGHMLPWVVRDLASDTIIGSTRYHDIVPNSIGWRSATPFYGRAASGLT